MVSKHTADAHLKNATYKKEVRMETIRDESFEAHKGDESANPGIT